MSQILSVIMVIVMAFSSMTGMMTGIEEAVSFDVKISIDAEAVLALSGAGGAEVPEETRQAIKVIGDVLDALTLRGVATKDTAELDLLAGGDVALSIGMKNEEKGITVASSLLSSDVIFVSAETLEQLKQQMAASGTSIGMDTGTMDAMQNLDNEQIRKDCDEVGAKLTEAIEAKKGETEAGEFTVDGLAFIARTPVNMTYAEFMELLLTCAKELSEKESLKPVLQMNTKDMGAEIDKALEELKNQPEEDYPEFELVIYTDADNCSYYVCNMAKQGKGEDAQAETTYFAYGEVEGLMRSHVSVEQAAQKMDITYAGTKEDAYDLQATIEDRSGNAEITASKDDAGKLDMVCVIKAQGGDIKLVIKSEPAEGERVSFSADVFYGGGEKPLASITGTAGKGGETVSVFEDEKLNVTTLETLMNPEDTTVSGQLQMKMMAGLLKSITVVTKNVPEDTAAWINDQIKQMMSPKTPTVPQGN